LKSNFVYKDLNKGAHVIKFYKGNEPEYVVVDEYLWFQRGKLAFASLSTTTGVNSSDRTLEVWAPLMEKA